MLFCLNKMILKDGNAINIHYLPFLCASRFVKERFCLCYFVPLMSAFFFLTSDAFWVNVA